MTKSNINVNSFVNFNNLKKIKRKKTEELFPDNNSQNTINNHYNKTKKKK